MACLRFFGVHAGLEGRLVAPVCVNGDALSVLPSVRCHVAESGLVSQCTHSLAHRFEPYVLFLCRADFPDLNKRHSHSRYDHCSRVSLAKRKTLIKYARLAATDLLELSSCCVCFRTVLYCGIEVGKTRPTSLD